MKFVIVFAALFAVALAAPPRTIQGESVVLKSDSDVRPDGFSWLYETSDGIKAQEAGQLKSLGKDETGIAVQGSYSYVGDDGVTYTVQYIADENGFQPQGAHLPVA